MTIRILILASLLGCPQPVEQTKAQDKSKPASQEEFAKGTSFLDADPSDWSPKSREELLDIYSRTWHPDWSGQVILHLAPGHYILADDQGQSNDRRKRAFHLSAYDRESRIPLLVYSPRDPDPKQHTEPADLQRVGATLFDVLDVPRPKGVTESPLVSPHGGKPKIVVVMIYDALSWAHWDRYLAKLPNHAKLRSVSQEYVNTHLGHMSSSTTVSHSVLSTGQPPAQTGIPINHTRTGAGLFDEVFVGNEPSRLLVPTVADLYDAMHDNRPVIASFCSQSRAAIAMAGHGLSHEGGDADIVVWQKGHHKSLETNEKFWSMPSYLSKITPKKILKENPDAEFMGVPIRKSKGLFRSPLNIQVGERVVTQLLANEPFGKDELTDLLFINQKVLDNIAHRRSADGEPYRLGLDALDAYLARFQAQLTAHFGDDYLLILTSDHGFGPGLASPKSGPDPRRHPLSGLRTWMDQAMGIPGVVEDVQYLNMYLDEAKLNAGGRTLDDVCAAASRLPWVKACLTREEVLGSRDLPVERTDPDLGVFP